MLKISIPKPCHEDWNLMTPNEQGRHCNVCAKTVVDFTGMDYNAIQQYFLNRKEGSTCGRFKQTQLSRITISLPAAILQIQLPKWKQFLAACLLAFSSMLFSCDAVVTQGETTGVILAPVAAVKDSVVYHDSVTADSLQSDSLQPICTSTTGIAMIYDTPLTGDIEVKQADTTQFCKPVLTQPDTLVTSDSIIFTGLVPSKFPKLDSTQIKNPPAADSIKCDANSINYL